MLPEVLLGVLDVMNPDYQTVALSLGTLLSDLSSEESEPGVDDMILKTRLHYHPPTVKAVWNSYDLMSHIHSQQNKPIIYSWQNNVRFRRRPSIRIQL